MIDTAQRVARNVERLDEALERLEKAPGFAKSTHQTPVFQLADSLLSSEAGVRSLYERAHRFAAAGVFSGGPWADPRKLLPPLVRGCLEGGGIYPVIEALSELRMLALAKGRVDSEQLTAGDAEAFLQEVMALNLDLLFPRATEESRLRAWPHRDKCQRLFRLLAEELSLSKLKQVVREEIHAICTQRPILSDTVVHMIELVERIPGGDMDAGHDPELASFVSAIRGPGPLAKAEQDPGRYRRLLLDSAEAELEAEAQAFGDSLRRTGLVSVQHPILLRVLRRKSPDLIPAALGLNPLGQAELAQNIELAHQLLKVAILPDTASAVYGYAQLLERGLLSRSEVAGGLRRLVDLDLTAEGKRRLLAKVGPESGLTANQVLVAGAISILGQPLGIGQGLNPTCQAARGLSLWSQHAPGYLLEILASAARDGVVQMRFEEALLRSDELEGGVAREVDLDLDPVSVVLVPHLDKLYDEMMRRTALRPEDGHKWVNPGLYGRWVPHGFASLFDKTTGAVAEYRNFVRRFYASHHPAYNDGYELIYPNPVGLFVTNTHGDLLGLHAVSVQRIKEDEGGALRVFFFNPNNEGRQDWGQGICPSIAGHGELEGESSLPFHEFAARLYAFHYNPFEEGDAYAVPRETVAMIEGLAQESWGRSYTWTPSTMSGSLQRPD